MSRPHLQLLIFSRNSLMPVGRASGWVNTAQATHSVHTQSLATAPGRPYGLGLAHGPSAGEEPVCRSGWLTRSPLDLWREVTIWCSPPPHPTLPYPKSLKWNESVMKDWTNKLALSKLSNTGARLRGRLLAATWNKWGGKANTFIKEHGVLLRSIHLRKWDFGYHSKKIKFLVQYVEVVFIYISMHNNDIIEVGSYMKLPWILE